MVAPSRELKTVDIGKARISKSGQITIPVEVRRELGLEVGDTVVYSRNKEGTITIRRPRTAAQLSGIARHLPGDKSVTGLIDEMDRTPMVRSRYQEETNDVDIN